MPIEATWALLTTIRLDAGTESINRRGRMRALQTDSSLINPDGSAHSLVVYSDSLARTRARVFIFTISRFQHPESRATSGFQRLLRE